MANSRTIEIERTIDFSYISAAKIALFIGITPARHIIARFSASGIEFGSWEFRSRADFIRAVTRQKFREIREREQAALELELAALALEIGG